MARAERHLSERQKQGTVPDVMNMYDQKGDAYAVTLGTPADTMVLIELER